MAYDDIVVLNGRGASHLSYKPNNGTRLKIGEFKNRETHVELEGSVRGKDVVFLQSFGPLSESCISDNDLLMETLLACDTVRRAGCNRLNVVFPFMPYTRQDRKHKPGVPISARVVCDILVAMNINRLITFDLHADQIQGFMSNKVIFDHISLLPYMCDELEAELRNLNINKNNLVMVSPDAGAVPRTRMMGNLLSVFDLALISKVRTQANKIESAQLVGDVLGRTCLLVDDMIDTGGSLLKAYELLKEKGADRVIVIAVHGVFSDDALSRLQEFDLVMVSDTTPQCGEDLKSSNIKIVNISHFLEFGLFTRINYNWPIGELMKKGAVRDGVY